MRRRPVEFILQLRQPAPTCADLPRPAPTCPDLGTTRSPKPRTRQTAAAYGTSVLVGRASLLSDLRARIEEGAAVVLTGEAGQGKTTVVEALTSPADPAPAGPAGVTAYVGGALSTLTWLPFLPLARAVGRPDLSGDVEQVAALVGGIVGEDLLVVEDLHWSDDSTLAVLARLAGTTTMLLTSRRPGLPEPLADCGIDEVPLPALDPGDAFEVVRSVRPDLDPSGVAAVVGRAEGNPLLLHELATGSTNLRTSVLARVARLSPAAVEWLERLALIQRPAREDYFPRAVLDELDAVQLVRRLPGGPPTVAVRHATIADILIGDLPPDRLRLRHLQLGTVIADPAEAAHHLEQAGELDRARDAALAAAENARGLIRAHLLAVAARCSSGPGAVQRRLDAADALQQTADPVAAEAVLDPVEAGPAGDDATRARALMIRARTRWYLLDDDAARSAIEEALVRAERVGGALEAEVRVETARTLTFSGDVDRAVAEAERALAATHELGLRCARAHLALGTASYYASSPRWEAEWTKAGELAVTEGDAETELIAGNNVAEAYVADGKLPLALDLMSRMRDRARELEMLGWVEQFAVSQVNASAHTGEPRDIVAAATELLGRAMVPRARDQIQQVLIYALIDLGQGHLASASIADGARTEGVAQASYLLIQAEQALAEGRNLDARRLADSALPGTASDEVPFPQRIRAWAPWEVGEQWDVPEIRTREFTAGSLPEQRGVSLLDTDPGVAAGQFEEAAGLWAPYYVRAALLCRWAQGEALRRAGDADRARELLLALDAELEASGRRPLQQRVHRSLRLLGHRFAAPRTERGDLGLTGREREVVDLVAGGLTNAEIARRLGIGRPTVVRILSTAMATLGVTTRGQAAAVVTAGGQPATPHVVR